MDVKLYEKRYIEIARVISLIMPIDATEYIVQCEIFPNTESCKLFWNTLKIKRREYSMENFPDEAATKLIILFKDLNRIMHLDGNYWSHCQFILTDKGEFNIKFTYVEEEDSWSMLYMKGISDLTKEEAEEYCIPLEIWEERVRIRKSKENR